MCPSRQIAYGGFCPTLHDQHPEFPPLVGKPPNAFGPCMTAYGYKRSPSASRLMSAWARIADTIGRKADVAWECAARAEIYAACAASSRSTCCTVAVDIRSSPAICRIDPPASLAWTTARRRAREVRGRPMGFPDFVPCSLARARPAWMRSAMISRSNSANTPSIWNIAETLLVEIEVDILGPKLVQRPDQVLQAPT